KLKTNNLLKNADFRNYNNVNLDEWGISKLNLEETLARGGDGTIEDPYFITLDAPYNVSSITLYQSVNSTLFCPETHPIPFFYELNISFDYKTNNKNCDWLLAATNTSTGVDIYWDGEKWTDTGTFMMLPDASMENKYRSFGASIKQPHTLKQNVPIVKF